MSLPNPVTKNKPKILVVDDSRVMRYAFKKILNDDYEVLMAENGEDGWELITKETDLQVVFTDLSMPVLDGLGLLLRMRDSDVERIKEIPVVIITGKEDVDSTKEEVLAQGASDFIAKPFDSAKLRARAKANLRLKQTAEKLEQTSQKLQKESTVDEATGLGSLRYFEKTSIESFALIKRHGGSFVMMYLSINNISSAKTQYGAGIANAIIKEIGKRIALTVRTEDKAARISDSTFGFLLLSSDLANAKGMAKRIHAKIGAIKFNIKGQVFKAQSSIGLYEPDVHANISLEEIKEKTEVCLKEAILAGNAGIVERTDKQNEKSLFESGNEITSAALTPEIGKATTPPALAPEVTEAAIPPALDSEVGDTAMPPAALTPEVAEAASPPALDSGVGDTAMPPAALTPEVGEAKPPAALTPEVGDAASPPAFAPGVGEAKPPAALTPEVAEAASPPALDSGVGDTAMPPAALPPEVTEAAIPPALDSDVGEAIPPTALTPEVTEAASPPALDSDVGDTAMPPAALTPEVSDAASPPALDSDVGEAIPPAALTPEVTEAASPPAFAPEVDEAVSPPRSEVGDATKPPALAPEIGEAEKPATVAAEIGEKAKPAVASSEVEAPALTLAEALESLAKGESARVLQNREALLAQILPLLQILLTEEEQKQVFKNRL